MSKRSDWTPVSNFVFADVLGEGRFPPPRQSFFLMCLARVLRYENSLLHRGHRIVESCSPLARSSVSGGLECVSKCLSKSFFVLNKQLKHSVQRNVDFNNYDLSCYPQWWHLYINGDGLEGQLVFSFFAEFGNPLHCCWKTSSAIAQLLRSCGLKKAKLMWKRK